MKRPEEAYSELERMIDGLLMGKPVELLDAGDFPDSLHLLAEKMNRLADSMGQTVHFARELSRGNLDPVIPDRRNYVAAPLKEIHSQLISLSYSMQQLLRGNMTNKMYYPGDLYYWYNKIVERAMQDMNSSDGVGWDTVNSWRYHQMLSAINQLHIMILEVNERGEIVFANPPAREMIGERYIPYDLPDDEIKSELMLYLSGFAGRVDQFTAKNTVTAGFPVFHELYDSGAGSWYKIISDIIHLVDGSYGILHMIDDISEWKRHEEQLTISASTDPLTGTYTRKVGQQKLREVIKLRFVQKSCVAFVDIDNLKDINDGYGHAEGDFAIAAVADVLKFGSRAEDWVIRQGGDEFVVIFGNCRYQTAERALERMAVNLSEMNDRSGKPYRVVFSAGLTEIEPEMADVRSVLAVVDERMYRIKKGKKAKQASG